MKQTVVFDFDGVINSYKSGWQGLTYITDEPVKGIKKAIDSIRAEGYEVIVVSTRCADYHGKCAVEEYLRKHGITVDNVMAEKPPAIVYIDDRAITFDGDASSLLEKIRSFVPWNKCCDMRIRYEKIPCCIGDEVWAIRRYRDELRPKKGIVKEMFFTENMKLCIVVQNIRRGFWGVNVFATKEETEEAIKKLREV